MSICPLVNVDLEMGPDEWPHGRRAWQIYPGLSSGAGMHRRFLSTKNRRCSQHRSTGTEDPGAGRDNRGRVWCVYSLHRSHLLSTLHH